MKHTLLHKLFQDSVFFNNFLHYKHYKQLNNNLVIELTTPADIIACTNAASLVPLYGLSRNTDLLLRPRADGVIADMEQFHRWSFNWRWHSSSPDLMPSVMEGIRCRYFLHNWEKNNLKTLFVYFSWEKKYFKLALINFLRIFFEVKRSVLSAQLRRNIIFKKLFVSI